jgi:hypothetical protein
VEPAVLSITLWSDKMKKNGITSACCAIGSKKLLVPTLCRYVGRFWTKSTILSDISGPQLSFTVTRVV